jgi:peptidyl-prolyl cis-trans isomerase SurA
VKYFRLTVLIALVAAAAAIPTLAQETELTVIDEGVVQVNDVVITLSRINREVNNAVDSLVREGKTREAATQEIESKKGRLIASIIEEELIMQKGKELNMERDVEARINQQFVQQKDELKLKSLDELFTAMRQQGIDPDDIRNALRSQITREWVFQSQVDDRVRFGITDDEIKKYFEAHKDQFTQPATITLSEIFLSFAGSNVEAVRTRAKDIVARLRAGEEFAKVAVENSDRPNVAEDKGSVGTIELAQLSEIFRKPLENVKVGGVSDPVELDEGIEILRVDARTAQGTESNFDENKVRLAILREKVPPERKKYMKSLKEDAYIKIADSYRPIVTPFLNDETPNDTTASN